VTGLRDLLEAVDTLERPLLLALDVDGTIAPIVRDPDAAEIPPKTLFTLQALAAAPGVELALITGRDLPSLGRMEKLEGIWRAVEHGGIVLAPGEAPSERTLSPAQHEALAAFSRWVDEHAADAFVERKPQAIAVHVRAIAEQNPTRAHELMDAADALASKLGLHVRRGRALREAEAVRHDKGAALAEIFERSGARSAIFVGDDLTDFPAIEVASALGFGVFVRSKEQRGAPIDSTVILEGVHEVTMLLDGVLRSVTG
jgi:trehalose-phosphatase